MRARPAAAPSITLLETCWRMRSRQKATRILECGIYRVQSGVEVRVGYGPDDLLYSHLVVEIGGGRTLAAALRETVLAKGGFDELPVTSPTSGEGTRRSSESIPRS